MIKTIKTLIFFKPSQKSVEFVCDVFKITTKTTLIRGSEIVKHSAISFSNGKLKCCYSLTHNKECINIPNTSSYINPVLNVEESDISRKKTLNSDLASTFGLDILKLSSYYFFNKLHITPFDNSKKLIYGSNSNKVIYYLDVKDAKNSSNFVINNKKLEKIEISKEEFSKNFTAGILDFNQKNHEELKNELHVDINSVNFKLFNNIDS